MVLNTALIQILLRFSSINFFLLTWKDCMSYCGHYFHYIFSVPLAFMLIEKLSRQNLPVRPKQTKFIEADDQIMSTEATDDEPPTSVSQASSQ